MGSTRPSSSRPASPPERAGAAAGKQPMHLPERFPVAKWCVRRGIGTATGVSLRYAGGPARTSMPGSSPKDGRSHTGGTRGRTSARRRRHERRGGGSGGANSFRPGSGGTNKVPESPERNAPSAASRETSIARGSASTTSPETTTINAPGLTSRRASAGSVQRPRPARRDGEERETDPVPTPV